MDSINNPSEDPSSPFYLHYSQTLGTSIVSQILIGSNYASWRRAMLIALSVKNKLGFIDGTIKKPGNDINLSNSWIRNNNIVIYWILNSVSKEIAASLLYLTTTKEIWEDLEDRFRQTSGPRIFQLQTELFGLRQGSSSVSEYFTRLKTIWEELANYRSVCSCGDCSCGGVKQMVMNQQIDYTLLFLMGLTEDFAHTRAQILLMDPIPPVNKVFGLVLQEECQKGIAIRNHPKEDEVAFAFKKDKGDTSGSQRRKPRPQCTYCNVPGHTRERCYKLYGYPPGYKPRQKYIKIDTPVSNQVSVEGSHSVMDTQPAPEHDNVQCIQLMQILIQQLQQVQTKDSSSVDSS